MQHAFDDLIQIWGLGQDPDFNPALPLNQRLSHLCRRRFAADAPFDHYDDHGGILSLYASVTYSEVQKNISCIYIEYLGALMKYIAECGSSLPAYRILYLNDQNGCLHALNSLEIITEHLNQDKSFPFADVHLYIYETEFKSEYMLEALKKFLKAVSKYPHFDELRLYTDNVPFTDSQKEDLYAFFKENKMCVRLLVESSNFRDLPLENLIAENRRERNIASLQLPLDPVMMSADKAVAAGEQEESEEQEEEFSDHMRACKLPDFDASLERNVGTHVMLELQVTAQQQVTQTTQAQITASAYVQSTVQNTVVAGLEARDFINRAQYVDSQTPDKRRGRNAIWTACISKCDLPHSIKYVTHAAIHEIERQSLDIPDGISFTNPPAGFHIVYCEDQSSLKNNGYILCYNHKKEIENKNESPLTVKFNRRKAKKKWLGAFHNEKPWVQKNRKKEDNKKILYELFAGHGYENYNFMFKKENVNTLLVVGESLEEMGEELYFLYGAQYHGGSELLSLLLESLKSFHHFDSNLCYHFIRYNLYDEYFSAHKESYKVTVSDLEIIEKLKKLTRAQKNWWMTLTQYHMPKRGIEDLAYLYNAFEYFLSKWPENCYLPLKCPIKNCSDMLLGMDRLLFILSKVHPQHLLEQIGHLNQLDYSMEGAYYAALHEEFTFFHDGMALRPDCLIEDQPIDEFLGLTPKVYKTSYADLNKMAELTDQTIALMSEENQKLLNDNLKQYGLRRLHRFIGCSPHICADYQLYLELNAQLEALDVMPLVLIKMLPLLALAVTGPRIKEGFDAAAFIKRIHDFVEFHYECTIDTLVLLSNVCDPNRLERQHPVFDELLGLFDIFYLSKNDPLFLANLDNIICGESLTAFGIWHHNSKHLPPHDFISLVKKLKEIDEEHISEWSKMAASVSFVGLGQFNEDAFLDALRTLKCNKPLYESVLRIFSSIDVQKTDANHIPSMLLVSAYITELDENTAPGSVFSAVKTLFPSCHFNIAASYKSVILDPEWINQIQELNQFLNQYEIKKWDIDRLRSENGLEYLKKKYTKTISTKFIKKYAPKIIEKTPELWSLSNFLANELTLTLAIAGVKKFVMPFIEEGVVKILESLYLEEINSILSDETLTLNFSGLQESKFPKPLLTGSHEGIDLEMEALQRYKDEVGGLFKKLKEIGAYWGKSFNLDFLINSLRTEQLGAAHVDDILCVCAEVYPREAPNKLLNAIFSQNALIAGVDADQFAEQICNTIRLPELGDDKKIKLIECFSSSQNGDDKCIDLFKMLRKIQMEQPGSASDAFELCIALLEKDGDREWVGLTQEILNISSQADDRVALIFRKLKLDPETYIRLLNCFDSVQENRKNGVLSIIAYSLIKSDLKKKNIEDMLNDSGLISKINNLPDNDFALLVSVFDKTPKPRLTRIEKFLKINTFTGRQKFFEKYEKDPFGCRLNEADIDKQFDLTGAREQIDRIKNPLTKQRLPYSHREALWEALQYVTLIGRNFKPLYADKPIKDLSAQEIKEYVLVLKNIMDLPDSTLHQKKVAKLEFVALAREAMVRATGEFAYFTQLLPILDSVLYGGNVVYAIRTGEGKSLIGNISSALDWLTDGVVNNCSSTSELSRVCFEAALDFNVLLGIESAFIHKHSGFGDYKQNGINFGEGLEMELFKTNMELFGHPIPHHVSLNADELDYHVLDNATEACCSVTLDPNADPKINPHAWAYPIILLFVKNDALFKNKKCHRDRDIKNLRKFIIESPEIWSACLSEKDRCRVEQFQFNFTKFDSEILDTWLNAAFDASQLKETEHFSVFDVIVENNEHISDLRTRINHRPESGRDFSKSVDPLLRAQLNVEISETPLERPLFRIKPEQDSVASKSFKNIVDYYVRPEDCELSPRGHVRGLTGTPGSEAEMRELERDYNMRFLEIPPHLPLARYDSSVIIAYPQLQFAFGVFYERKTPWEAHAQVIKERLIYCLEQRHAVLLVCKNVEQSEKLHEYLKTDLSKKHYDNMQLYNGEQLAEEYGQEPIEEEVVTKGSQIRCITITTPMLGRGTDFKPPRDSAGLAVVHTFIDTERNMEQAIGRSGRQGQKGRSEWILSTEEFTSRNKNIHLDNISVIQKELTQQDAEKRRKRNQFADVRNQFYQDFIKIKNAFSQQNESHVKRIAFDLSAKKIWSKFLKKMDREWQRLQELPRVIAYKNKMTGSGKKYNASFDDDLITMIEFCNKQWSLDRKKLLESMLQNDMIENNEPPFTAVPKLLDLFDPNQLKPMPNISTDLLNAEMHLQTNPDALYIKVTQIDDPERSHDAFATAWKDIVRGAEDRISIYEKAWWKSSDRRDAWKDFNQKWVSIKNLDIEDDKKIDLLIYLIRNTKKQLRAGDLQLNESRCCFFPVRNSEKSRFLSCLDDILDCARSQAALCNTGYSLFKQDERRNNAKKFHKHLQKNLKKYISARASEYYERLDIALPIDVDVAVKQSICNVLYQIESAIYTYHGECGEKVVFKGIEYANDTLLVGAVYDGCFFQFGVKGLSSVDSPLMPDPPKIVSLVSNDGSLPTHSV